MANQPKPIGLHEFFEIGLRRKWYIIIPFVVAVLASFGVYKYLPKVYQATTLILVQPQSVPENYVRPTVTASVINRLNTISQEILSRTRLEKVIEEFNLYADIRKKAPMEQVVENMRKGIQVQIGTPSFKSREDQTQVTFSISYEGEDPRTVMMVANKLASMIIEENLKVRETQAVGTSDFIVKELDKVENQLKKKEQDIRNYKERSMGQLPQQLDANLRILERLQQQLQTTSENMRASEDKIVLFQSQIEQLKKREPISNVMTGRRNGASNSEDQMYGRTAEDPLVIQLNTLKRDLAAAQSRYKDTHPDVIDLKKKIARLEPQVEAEKLGRAKNRQEGVTEENLSPPMPSPETQRLLAQYTDQYNNALLESKRAKEEINNIKDQITFYQRRVEDTPRREQELTFLTRDYELMKTNYQSLLDKKTQSEMAENLERKQKGEQFKILDPARVPEKPVKPDRNKTLLIGAFIGIALGFGLTWFRESMDQCFRTVKEIEEELGIPVVATIPNLKENRKAA